VSALDDGERARVLERVDEFARLTPADVFKQLYRDRFADDAPVELLSAFGELLRVAEAEGR